MVVEKECTPLIVVSNRLPFVLNFNENGIMERKPNAGGLVTAVAPVVISCKGLWIGWSGLYDLTPGFKIPESNSNDKTPSSGLRSSQIIPVQFDKSTFDAFYNGCCNGTLWPLFHSMSERAIFKVETWKAYCRVNDEFAKNTVKALKMMLKNSSEKRNDKLTPIVWIHDYQLFTASRSVRKVCTEENLRCKLGFFLHIPFPSWDILKILPWNEDILEGMLACDLIGFHVEDYCLNFIDCCSRRLGCQVDRTNLTVEYGGRSVQIRAHPIGVPFDKFGELARSSPVFVKDVERSKIVLGVDRLDYTKGLVNRILAFEKFLEKYPEHLEKVTLLQISVPSRTDVEEYKMLKEELDLLIGRVNGRFSKPNWSPIRYIYGFVNQEQLAALYRDSSVALVTPLRDGMNLVAKEFVACQVNDPGVLVLSQFAGSGVTMSEALLVNPYEIENVAAAIDTALKMPLEERQNRMNQLRKREKDHDVTFWMNSYLSSISGLVTRSDEKYDYSNSPDLFRFEKEKNQICFLLDYDIILANVESHLNPANLQKEIKQILERMITKVNIIILSDKSAKDVAKILGVKKITYAGYRGLEIIHPDGTQCIYPLPDDLIIRLSKLKGELEKEVGTENVWFELTNLTLKYYYKESSANVIAFKERSIFEKHGFQPPLHNSTIETKLLVKMDKNKSIKHILKSIFGYDWYKRVNIIYFGLKNKLKSSEELGIIFHDMNWNSKKSLFFNNQSTQHIELAGR